MIGHLVSWMDKNPGKAGTLAGWYMQGSSALGAVIALPIVIRVLGDDTAGLWFGLNGFLMVVALTDLGLGYVLARQIAYSLAAKGDDRPTRDFIPTEPGWLGVAQVYGAGRRLAGYASIAGALVVVVLCQWVIPSGKLGAHDRAETLWVGYMLGASAILVLLAKPHSSLIEGLGKVHWSRLLSGTHQLLAAFGSLGVLLLGGGVRGMAFSVVFFSLIYLVGVKRLGAALLRGKVIGEPAPGRGMIRQLIRVALPLGAVNAGAFLVSAIQIPLVGSILGPTAVTPLYLAQKVGQLANQAVMQFVFPQLPRFTGRVAAGDRTAASDLLAVSFRRTFVLSALVNVLFVFASPWFVGFVVGPGRYPEQRVLLAMALDAFIMTVSAVLAQFVLASGRNPFFFSTLLSGAVSLAFCWAFVDKLGLLGVPVCSLITGMAINYWFVPFHGLRLFRELKAHNSTPTKGGACQR